MTFLKVKTKRLSRLNNAWWLNDWSSNVSAVNGIKTSIPAHNNPSNIVLKSNEESIAMIKTKSFLSESLGSSESIDGTIIIGSASNVDVQEPHEMLLNIQPHGWIYIIGGKNEKQ